MSQWKASLLIEVPPVIEAEVHQQLRAFLRAQGESQWPHHLTMARLVARALRVGRSSLLQVSPPAGYHGRYRLSYLMPLLLWPEPAVLVVPEPLQRRLVQVEIPRLRQWISSGHKPIQTGDRWPHPDFKGLLITSPSAWLSDRLTQSQHFPPHIPTIIDHADDLEAWARQALTATVQAADWEALRLAYPHQQELIRDVRVQLTHAIFQHPANPYHCHLVEEPEREILLALRRSLNVADRPQSFVDWRDLAAFNEMEALVTPNDTLDAAMPAPWPRFWQQLRSPDLRLWANTNRAQGQVELACGPVNVATALQPIWQQQPVVIVGGAVDLDVAAPLYRQRLGLGDMTCLKFAPHRQQDLIQLYVPDRLPFPNQPQFQPALLQEIRQLLTLSAVNPGFTVILVQDTPLQSQLAATIAAEFGSRVQVEKTGPDDNGILVTGWEFWRSHQGVLPTPQLLIITTLPLPSLEHPLVAARVADYKRQRQDWFRLFLLPEALSELQRAIAPVRDSQGLVALLDNRVNHRSYGAQVLNAMSPAARINYVDDTVFTAPDRSRWS